MKKLYAVYRKSDARIEFLGHDTLTYTKDDLTIDILGNIYYRDAVNDCEALLELYGKCGNDITKNVTGCYIMMIRDDSAHTLTVLQSELTSGIYVYFTEDIENIYVSTSVKNIYTYCKAPRSLNYDAADDFIANGIINNNETLIEGLYKLCRGQMLSIADASFSISNAAYPENTLTEDEGRELFPKKLLKGILNDARETANVALSSGYYSNYILNALRKIDDGPINAFATGIEDADICEKIISMHSDVTLSVPERRDSFQSFPDIVWRLEGAAFDDDIVRQYAFFKTVSASGADTLIFDSCAAELFDHAFNKITKKGKLKSTASKLSIQSELSKISILANSFGIDARCPYISGDVLSVLKAVNVTKPQASEIFDDICKEQFSSELYDTLKNSDVKKVAVDTDTKSVFDAIEHSKWRSKTGKGILTRISRVLYFAVMNLKYGALEAKDMVERMKNRRYQALLYLIIFEKLFISGQFDSRFNDDGINLRVKDIL